MTEDKSPEQIAKAKEEKRQASLETFKNNGILNLAAAFLIENGAGSQYGPAVQNAIHNYQYLPILEKGEANEIIVNQLINSRVQGKKYSGSFTEAHLLESGMAVFQESLESLKVSDVIGMIGIDEKINGKYQNMYVSDLKELKDDKDAQKAYQTISQGYISYFLDGQVIDALGAQRKASVGGLEKELIEQGVLAKSA
jgi:hypothetical protein